MQGKQETTGNGVIADRKSEYERENEGDGVSDHENKGEARTADASHGDYATT